MGIYIPTARYWRIAYCRPATGNGYHDSVVRIVTALFTDIDNNALAFAGVTNVGSRPVYSGVIANVGDTDTATDAVWANYLIQQHQYGEVVIQYDMGIPKQPAKIRTRLSDTATTITGVAGNYTMQGASLTYGYILASADGVNWDFVCRVPAFAPGGFNTTNFFTLDELPAYSYRQDIKKPLSGDGGIYGIVAEDGIPVSRPVILFDRESFMPYKRVLSTDEGAYSFENLNRDRDYMVLAVDTTEEPGQPGVYKNALVRDRITPIPANGLPTDGLPWFWRVRRSMVLRPACEWNYYGPGDKFTGVYGMGRAQKHWGSATYMDTAAGGGYDLRGIPIPVPVGLRAMYPKMLSHSQMLSGLLNTPSEFTIELIAEIPSGSDPPQHYVFGGQTNYTGYTYGNYPFFMGVVIETLTSGAVNVRFATNTFNTLNTIRVAGTATPGTIAHILVSYAENQQINIYINGALSASASMAGVGQIRMVGLNGTSWASALAADVAGGVLNRQMLTIQSMYVIAGSTLPVYSSSAPSARADAGVVYAAVFPGAFHNDPDAGGLPISVRDTYESWANNAVWTGGSRPEGWPTSPSFTGYAIEVAADAPCLWYRLQDLGNTDLVTSIGSHFASGYFTGSGVTYGNTGMTSGMVSTGFTAHGGLRINGPVDTSQVPWSTQYGSHYTPTEQNTIEFWMRPSSFPKAQNRIIQFTRQNGAYTGTVYLNSSGNLVWSVLDSSGTVFSFTFAHVFSAATAYHIAITIDGVVDNKVRLYINGALSESLGYYITLPQDSGSVVVSIGNSLGASGVPVPYNQTVSANTYNYEGDLQDVAVYSYALSAARVAAHYDARNT